MRSRRSEPFSLPEEKTRGLRPFDAEDEAEAADLLGERGERALRFPTFEEDLSSLIYKRESPPASPVKSPQLPESDTADPIPTLPAPQPVSPIVSSPQPGPPPPPIPEIINPLDRPASPDLDFHNPFADPYPHAEHILDTQTEQSEAQTPQDNEDMESIAVSRTTGREEDENSMSDWTEAFDNATESELGDFDGEESESDVVSDAESEASWARVRTNPSSSSSGRYDVH